jgi:hypothetical protein
MALEILKTLCCDAESATCFTKYCDSSVEVDNVIAAVGLIEEATLPKVGDTITISTEEDPIVLTDANYADSLLQWLRDQQFECNGGGEYFHFLNAGLLAKGTRTKPTTINSDNGSPYEGKRKLRQEATAELMLEEHYLPNTDIIAGLQERASSLSVIYFFKQGVIVKNANDDDNIYVSDAGFEVTGERNDFIKGSITLTDISKKDTFFYAANPSVFIKNLKEATKFTFGVATVTGITALACGSKGGCKAYSTTFGTAFTYTPIVNELTSCASWYLYLNCTDALGTVSDDISIDSTTGVVSGLATLPIGTYKFTIEVVNDCCINGSQCFTVEVNAA